MLNMSADISEIAKALLAFQSEATGVVKDSKNPHFKNRYASLEAVVDEARPVLQRVGISWMQAPGKITDGNIGMTTLLMHAESGQWISSDMEIPLGKQDPQGAGSALTYAQRYALMASLGLPPVDDDAESAINRNSSSAPAPGRNAAGPGQAPPATGSAANLSADAQIKRIKQFDLISEMMGWANSYEVDAAYRKLSPIDQDRVSAAFKQRQAEIEAGSQSEAA